MQHLLQNLSSSLLEAALAVLAALGLCAEDALDPAYSRASGGAGADGEPLFAAGSVDDPAA